jgi:hypothetical protein
MAPANGKCREQLARRHNPAMKKARESGGGRQASEAFLEYAQPLLETSRGPLEREGQAQMLTLAFAVWNAVVFERAGRRPRVLEGLRAALNGPAEREILEFLVKRKRSERPIDNRVVGDLQFVDGKRGEVGVRVSYAEYSHVADDPKLERIEAHILAGIGAPKAAKPKHKKKVTGAAPAKGEDAAPTSSERASSEDASGAKSARDKTASASAPNERPASAAPPRTTQPAAKTPSAAPQAAEVDAKELPIWRALYERASELRELEPWNWMQHSELFGVRFENESVVSWCCVMGEAEGVFGLAVYEGDAGFDVHRQILSDEDESEEALYGCDGYLVSFHEREDLGPLESERAEAAKVRAKGAHAWPQVERARQGRLPCSIELADAARVTKLLEMALAVARARRADPGLLAPTSDGALAVWSLSGGPPRVERQKPQPLPALRFPPVDELGVKPLVASAARSADVFEYDVFPAPAQVEDETGGAYIPAVLALVDSANGFAHCCEVVAPETRHAGAARQLLATFAQLGRLPREVRVCRAWVRAAVKPTLDALGVRTSFADELPRLEEFRLSMEDALERGELGG